ncbi:MAG: DNA-3-methyladenine glycosylase [Sporolactobacillus sp.]
MNSERMGLPVSFYHQPTLELARALLGCLLVKDGSDGRTSGYIVETEAYMGACDRAAHSFGNRRTKRTEIMFGQPGYAYVYTMHRHALLNVVSGPKQVPQAVLIRALEPAEGLELIAARRKGRKRSEWTNGPGKLTEALGITLHDYGHDLSREPLFIAGGFSPNDIASGVRIGIQNSGDARFKPWRFWVKGNGDVSHQRCAPPCCDAR